MYKFIFWILIATTVLPLFIKKQKKNKKISIGKTLTKSTKITSNYFNYLSKFIRRAINTMLVYATSIYKAVWGKRIQSIWSGLGFHSMLWFSLLSIITMLFMSWITQKSIFEIPLTFYFIMCNLYFILCNFLEGVISSL